MLFTQNPKLNRLQRQLNAERPMVSAAKCWFQEEPARTDKHREQPATKPLVGGRRSNLFDLRAIIQ